MSGRKPFAAQDGRGAEVFVERGRSQIKKIEFNKDKNLAQITVHPEYLKHAISGWIRLEDSDQEYADVIKSLYDSGEEIDYVVEVQRKPNASTETPIKELEIGDKTRIFAQVEHNGKVYRSSEAVTDPREYPSDAPGGRVSAVEANDRKKSEAPQQSATPVQDAHSATPSYNGKRNPYDEPAPTFRFFNTPHGQVINVGSYSVQAVVGTHTFTYDQIQRFLDVSDPQNEKAINDLTLAYNGALLNIADTLQSYFTKLPPNRIATSHTRIRAILFDVVRDRYPILMAEDPDQASLLTREMWFRTVGKEAMTRMSMVLNLDHPDAVFQQNVFFSGEDDAHVMTSRQKLAQSAPAPSAPAPSAPALSAPVQNDTSTPAQRPQSGPDVTDAETLAVRPAVPNSEHDASGMGALAEMSRSDESIQSLPPIHVDGANGDDASEETVEQLKTLLEETSMTTDEFASVLKYTFGQEFVKNIPDTYLQKFVEFYVDHEIENPGNMRRFIDSKRA